MEHTLRIASLDPNKETDSNINYESVNDEIIFYKH